MTANDLVSQVKNLTPVSNAALSLVGLLDKPDTSNDDIVDVLKFDNVLTAKLLRACNSPFFGLEEAVASVDQAVFILGHQQILHIALSIAFSGTMSTPLPGYAAEAKELWQHSLVTALAAESISKSSEVIPVDHSIAFTAGLLHDIGKVVMNHVLTDDLQSAIRARITESGLARTDAEKEILGVDHAEVGQCLLRSWRLPEDILEAVAHHHAPISQPQPCLSALVHLANCLAHFIGSDLGWEAFAVRADTGAVEVLGFDEPRIEELLITAHDSLDQVDNLMQMA